MIQRLLVRWPKPLAPRSPPHNTAELVTLDELIKRIADVETKAATLIASAESASALEAARTSLVGRKSGQLTALIKELPALAPEERRDAGAAVNRAKTSIESALDARSNEISSQDTSV